MPRSISSGRHDHLLRLRSQTIECIAQVDRAAGKEDLRASRQTDHSAPRMARRTHDSAFSLTKPATQVRTPFGNAIFDRSSFACAGPRRRRSARFRWRQQRPSRPACLAHDTERHIPPTPLCSPQMPPPSMPSANCTAGSLRCRVRVPADREHQSQSIVNTRSSRWSRRFRSIVNTGSGDHERGPGAS
jgi:hypothetical protein